MPSNLSVGKVGEKIASEYLEKKGYSILYHNFYTRFGEIDIVCKKNNIIVFIEVKTRIGENMGKPYEQVTYSKRKALFKAFQYYLFIKKPSEKKYRFDIISIKLSDDGSSYQIKHFENIQLLTDI